MSRCTRWALVCRHWAAVGITVVIVGCSGSSLPSADRTPSASTPQVADPSTSATDIENGDDVDLTDESSFIALPGEVIVDATASVPFDRRLLGTNVPAWIGPERLADPDFQSETVASGASVLRMPGGSWSNAYDWLGCELGDDSRCFWTWAARPTDFIDFLQATDLDGMWTVSINETAQAAAAAVAFFNGDPDDTTEIGVDRNGVEWETVGTWARLRADGGNPDPIGIDLWEVGNEVYGGKPAGGGAECADFGWEEVWTCDGAEYVAGTDDNDGYLQIRAAMVAVDPDIEVGAVGVAGPGEWTNWGNEVIDGAAGELDFYVVHDYGFDASPSVADALDRPAQLWPDVLGQVTAALPDDVPVAVTEYNLVSFEAGDTERTMTSALNALFIADSIGQIARSGASIANQWNLANGVTSSGTDYGMIDLDDGARRPQFEALQAWSSAGTSLFGAAVGDDDLRVYPTRHDDGSWTLIVISLTSSDRSVAFTVPDIVPESTIEVTVASAADLTATSIDLATSSVDVSSDPEATPPTIEVPGHSILTIDVPSDASATESAIDG